MFLDVPQAVVAIKDNEVLHVGDAAMFRNNTVVETTQRTVEYTVHSDYHLYRTSYGGGGDYVYYNNYYYYWNNESYRETAVIGEYTTTTTKTYSYLKYGIDENIAVQTKTEILTKYGYDAGFRTFDRSYSLNLNGYFTSETDLANKCPDLLARIDTRSKVQIYVSATEKRTVSTSSTLYTTYYYIENV